VPTDPVSERSAADPSDEVAEERADEISERSYNDHSRQVEVHLTGRQRAARAPAGIADRKLRADGDTHRRDDRDRYCDHGVPERGIASIGPTSPETRRPAAPIDERRRRFQT
jgi:hypothetical protein